MPTGYTAPIRDGMTFEAFVMNCARAFGALIELRDDMTAPIPDAFQPSEYHATALEQAKKDLAVLDTMTVAEARRRAVQECSDAKDAARESVAKQEADRAKYDAMLVSVRAWTPPTKNHEGLKTFMVQQIEESIKFDCESSWAAQELRREPLSGAAWKEQKREQLTRDVAYHQEHHEDDVRRAAERTAWVRALRDSLSAVEAR